MIARLRRRQDALLAVVVGVCGVVPAVSDRHQVELGCVIAVVTAGAVAVRRISPLTALVAVQAGGVLVTVVHADAADTAGFVLAYLVLLYTAGTVLTVRRSVVAVALSLAAFWLEDAWQHHPFGEYAFGALLAIVPWLVGRYVAHQRALRIRLAAALDGERQALAAVAVAEERRRIAAETHALVTRGLAEIAEHGTRAAEAIADPLSARNHVRAINAVARRCVDEMRTMLRVLRADERAPVVTETSPPSRAIRSGRVAADVAVPVAVLAIGVVPSVTHGHRPVVDCALALLVAAAVAFRDRAPLVAVSVIAAVAVGVTAVSPQAELGTAYLVGSLLTLLSVGSRCTARPACGGLAIGLGAYWAVDALTASPPAGYLASAVFAGGVWSIGVLVRRERRLRRDLTVALDAERRALAAVAASGERRRLARELHDVVAHGLSAIAVQSAAADAALEVDPARAAEPVTAITHLTGQCAEEMHVLLYVLDGDDTRSADLDTVLSTQAELGLTVEHLIDAAALHACDVATRHAVARIVQEALTNVRRHSQAVVARVEVSADAGAVRVAVVDPGPRRPPEATAAGHGIVGLSERAASLGGTCTVGADGDGWRVDARLPVARTLAGHPA